MVGRRRASRRSLAAGSVPLVGRTLIYYKYSSDHAGFHCELCNWNLIGGLSCHSSSSFSAEWCGSAAAFRKGFLSSVHGDVVVVCGWERRESSVECCEAIRRYSFAAGIASRCCSRSRSLVSRLEGRRMLESHMSWEGQWLPA